MIYHHIDVIHNFYWMATSTHGDLLGSLCAPHNLGRSEELQIVRPIFLKQTSHGAYLNPCSRRPRLLFHSSAYAHRRRQFKLLPSSFTIHPSIHPSCLEWVHHLVSFLVNLRFCMSLYGPEIYTGQFQVLLVPWTCQQQGGSSHYAVLTRSLGEFLPFGRTGPGPGKDRNGSGLIHSGYTLTTGTMRMSWQLLRPHKSVCRMELARCPTSCSRPGV